MKIIADKWIVDAEVVHLDFMQYHCLQLAVREHVDKSQQIEQIVSYSC